MAARHTKSVASSGEPDVHKPRVAMPGQLIEDKFIQDIRRAHTEREKRFVR